MEKVAEIQELLRAANKTVSTAESITAGHLQSRIASVSGASDVFKGGITAYWKSAKVGLLGVDDALAEKTNCVDEEIARQMALGALRRFHTDYALATCGYAEREDGGPYAYVAVARAPAEILLCTRIELSGSRIEAQREAAERALSKFHELLRNEAGCH
jgi:nicotinamide-nucleotide amidase